MNDTNIQFNIKKPSFDNSSAFKKLLTNTFDKYPLNHSLNKEAVNKFIQASDLDVRDICKKIIDNTTHISFEFFLIKLNSCINELLKIINPDRPIFVYTNYNIETYMNKSNYWIFLYFNNYIKLKTSNRIEIIIITSSQDINLRDDDFIIFIDDCIYSGAQIKETISKFENLNYLQLNLFILIPFVSRKGLDILQNTFNSIDNLKEYCNLIFCQNSIIIKKGDDILTSSEIIKISSYYSKGMIDFKNTYFIYFDHKLASLTSTITAFYLGLVPNKYNKQKLSDYIINYDELIIIPIINNCHNYINKIDFFNPKCPYPPYKQGFLDFIKQINKDKKKSLKSYNKIKSF